MLSRSNLSDGVFPTSSDQLRNFSQGTNESVQITIPADALNSLTTADSEPSKMPFIYCWIVVCNLNFYSQDFLWFRLFSEI